MTNRPSLVCMFAVCTSLMGLVSPAFAQRPPARAWFDIDDAWMTPTEQAKSYSISQRLFDEVATASVSYPAPVKARVPAFGGGVRIYRRFGAGVRVAAKEQQTLDATIAVSVPDPVFFNRPRTAQVAMPLERIERTLDLSVEYLLPLPDRLTVRAFAGRSRIRITQGVIQQVRYAEANGGKAVNIEDVSEQTASGFAWGALFGVDAGFFVLRNVGVGIQIARRTADIPTQFEPFSAGQFDLSPHRTAVSAGLRLRF